MGSSLYTRKQAVVNAVEAHDFAKPQEFILCSCSTSTSIVYILIIIMSERDTVCLLRKWCTVVVEQLHNSFSIQHSLCA